jgi:hypothetical protein
MVWRAWRTVCWPGQAKIHVQLTQTFNAPKLRTGARHAGQTMVLRPRLEKDITHSMVDARCDARAERRARTAWNGTLTK